MATEASIQRAAQAATKSVLQDLSQAAKHLAAASKPFGKPVGFSWGDLARKLGQRPDSAPHYQALAAALAEAAAAVARAEKAAEDLRRATDG